MKLNWCGVVWPRHSLATPQTVLQYASMLEERRFFEASFAAFEKGLARFKYPHAFLLWYGPPPPLPLPLPH